MIQVMGKEAMMTRVYRILDSPGNERDGKFSLRAKLHYQKDPEAFEQVVQMMYWVDRLATSDNLSPYRKGTPNSAYLEKTSRVESRRLTWLAEELSMARDEVIEILKKDPDYQEAL